MGADGSVQMYDRMGRPIPNQHGMTGPSVGQQRRMTPEEQKAYLEEKERQTVYNTYLSLYFNIVQQITPELMKSGRFVDSALPGAIADLADEIAMGAMAKQGMTIIKDSAIKDSAKSPLQAPFAVESPGPASQTAAQTPGA